MPDELAVYGGKPVIQDTNSMHIEWPNISKETEEAVLNQLHTSISIYDKSGIFDEFERKFKNFHNRKYALLTNSGTTALYSMYIGADIGPGDEVICPSYTFFATVTPILFTGAIPVLCDSANNGNIDPEKIKKRITKRTKAIVVTHMWGIPCDMDPIVEIADENDLLLFEDCSHACGALYQKRKVGTFGDAAVWSLNVQKIVQGGEGGILLTDNDTLHYRALLLGHYNKRCLQEIPKNHELWKFAVTGMGLKLRAHPLAIAIANQQFSQLETVLQKKRAIARKMIEGYSEINGVDPPLLNLRVEPAWYAFILQYNSEVLDGLKIDEFYKALIMEGCIDLDRPKSTCPLNLHALFQQPSVLFPVYKSKFKYEIGDFPEAENFYRNALKLPVGYKSLHEDIALQYVEAFRKVSNHIGDLT
jgi:perosamine synthetase